MALRFSWGETRSFAEVDANLAEVIARGAAKLGSVLGHRLLRWQVSEGHSQKALQDADPYTHRDPRRIEIPRGWRGLAEALGMAAQKGAPEAMREIVRAQAHCLFPLPSGGVGNLLQCEEYPGRGPHPGRVVITLGDPLMPGYAEAMKRDLGTSESARRARKLVPLLPLPPFVSKPKTHGEQATFAMYLVCALRLKAAELHRFGGALFEVSEIVSMADRSRLPKVLTVGERETLGWIAVLERWTDKENDDAMLEIVEGKLGVGGPVRLTLSASHAAARDYMTQAGREEVDGGEAGKRSAAKQKAAKARQLKGIDKKKPGL